MNRRISVVGLGYVGLPIAVEFGKKQSIIGFDIQESRIEELKKGYDRTGEVSEKDLKSAEILFTADSQELKNADFHIIAVPTPVDETKRPDLTPLLSASRSVGAILKKGDIVVYESTVYPGATEEDAIPVLEKVSGLKAGVDFKVGYSPERINPGDKKHTFTKIVKVVSAQDEESLDVVAQAYESVVEAGVYRASSIKVAESAKVIENIQRDVNIALMNELAIIFHKMGINTQEVLKASQTKWNFIHFYPGLVGGHCIGVDPYYMTHKSLQLGYTPQVILSGRKINDEMGEFISSQTVKELIALESMHKQTVVTILGITFKENVPDIRNSKVIDIIRGLKEYGVLVQVYDPHADPKEVMHEYGIELQTKEQLRSAHAVIMAVSHEDFVSGGWELASSLLEDKKGLVVDIKSALSPKETPNGIKHWQL